MRDRETIAAVSLSIAILGFNFLLGARLPNVWVDEVMYTDPAVNLALGRGLVSSAWYAQSASEVWAGYPPLYAVLLGGWLKVFGIGCVSARSLNFVLLSVLGLAMWWTVKKRGLIVSPVYRLMFLALFFLGMGMSWAYRTGRPDMLAATLSALVFLTASRPSGRAQGAALVFLGAMLPFCQLQLGLYAAVTSGFLLLVWRARHLRSIALVGTGCVVGALCLLSLYHQLGVIQGFWKSVIVHTSAGRHGAIPLAVGLRAVILDLAVIPLFVVLAIVGLKVAREDSLYRKEWVFGLLFSVILPFLFVLVGKYHIAYSWMVWIPLTFLTCRWVSLNLIQSHAHRKVCTLLLIVAMAGFPLRAASAMREWAARDYGRVQAFVDANLRPDDVIYSDHYPYYALVGKVKRAYFSGHRPLPEEAALINAYLMPVHLSENVDLMLLGQWEPSASFVGMSNSIPTLTLYRRKN